MPGYYARTQYEVGEPVFEFGSMQPVGYMYYPYTMSTAEVILPGHMRFVPSNPPEYKCEWCGSANALKHTHCQMCGGPREAR